MKKIDKKIEDSTTKATAYASMSAADKRKEALEVKPKINLALKLQVTKQDLKNRPHYQEVAEVFEEMLQATEKGLY
jgi:Skp family chaperone for outer membrane proteins